MLAKERDTKYRLPTLKAWAKMATEDDHGSYDVQTRAPFVSLNTKAERPHPLNIPLGSPTYRDQPEKR